MASPVPIILLLVAVVVSNPAAAQAVMLAENLRSERVKSGTKNGSGIRARFWSLLVLAQLPKAQKTGPFWGPHFGTGKPLLSSFLELQNLDTDREIPSNATSSSLDAAG